MTVQWSYESFLLITLEPQSEQLFPNTRSLLQVEEEPFSQRTTSALLHRTNC